MRIRKATDTNWYQLISTSRYNKAHRVDEIPACGLLLIFSLC